MQTNELVGQAAISEIHSSWQEIATARWVLVRMGGKAANEAKPNWLLIKEHDQYEQTAADEPITEKAPNSVLTQRDIEAIARDEDHVWQSNRPENSSPGKSSPANPSRPVPFAPSELPGEKRKPCQRSLRPS